MDIADIAACCLRAGSTFTSIERTGPAKWRVTGMNHPGARIPVEIPEACVERLRRFLRGRDSATLAQAMTAMGLDA